MSLLFNGYSYLYVDETLELSEFCEKFKFFLNYIILIRILRIFDLKFSILSLRFNFLIFLGFLYF